MEWYIFEETERQLPAPSFRLSSTWGRSIALDDYRQMSNLVLFFPHTAGGNRSRSVLEGFAAHLPDYRGEATAVLAIFPTGVAELAGLDRALNGAIPLLADAAGNTRRAYAGLVGEEQSDQDLLFVLDRYGAPLVALASGRPEDPEIHREILDWLVYSEIKCPE